MSFASYWSKIIVINLARRADSCGERRVGAATGRFGDQGSTLRARWPIEGRADDIGIAWISTGDRLEADTDVGDVSCQHALDEHQLLGEQRGAGHRRGGIGDPLGAGLDRRDPTGVGRVAERATDVVAETQRAHPGCDR